MMLSRDYSKGNRDGHRYHGFDGSSGLGSGVSFQWRSYGSTSPRPPRVPSALIGVRLRLNGLAAATRLDGKASVGVRFVGHAATVDRQARSPLRCAVMATHTVARASAGTGPQGVSKVEAIPIGRTLASVDRPLVMVGDQHRTA